VRRCYASFRYQAQSWNKPRCVVAKVEWHPDELYPRRLCRHQPRKVGRALRRLLQPARHGGPGDQGRQGEIKWTRLSCHTFAANTVRLQLNAPAYDLGNFMRALAMPKVAEPWSLTRVREKLIKMGAKVVSHGRYATFQMAEVAVSQQMFADILSLIAGLRAPPGQHEEALGHYGKRQGERYASMQAERRASAFRCRPRPPQIAFCLPRLRFTVDQPG
jgi:hypothetical protein